MIADHVQTEDEDSSKVIGNNIYNRWLVDVVWVTFR